MTDSADRAQRRASLVAAGILGTRVLGLVRQHVFARYFGLSPEADAFTAALRIPGVVRNLLGEGSLSASFVPVYAGLLEKGDHEGARRLSGTVFSLLVVATGIAALLGILLAPWIARFVALGFDAETADLTARIVRILFPMAALMVLSSWCLGVLNSHRRFFLSYAAPSLWNIAQIAVLVALGATWAGVDLVMALAWGALAGGGLQFLVQLPSTLRLTGRPSWNPRIDDDDTRRVVRAWLPMVFGAGVLQISTIIDTQLASILPGTGSVAALAYAQMIALLPISLFGVSVAAVALPELSREATTGDRTALADRLGDGAQRSLFFVLPSAAVFILLGEHVVAPILQTGEFGVQETTATVGVLVMFGVGLPARGLVRLVTSGHYAFGDTATPVRIAAATVLAAAGLAFLLMQELGVAGIALGGSLAAYGNVTANAITLHRRLPHGLRREHGLSIAIAVVATLGSVAVGRQVAAAVVEQGIYVRSALVLGSVGGVYLGLARVAGHPEARRLLRF